MIAVLLALSLGAQDKVDVRLAADVPITAVAVLGFAIPELLKNELTPAQCRLCDAQVDGVDAFFHDHLTGALWDRKTSDTISNVWVYALLPLSALGAAYTATGPYASDGAGWRAAMIVVEATAVQGAIVQAFKFSAARERPFARYGHGDASSTYDASSADSRISLPSGHTGFTAALGFSVAMTASLEESKAAPVLWGAAAAATVATGSLRMMAEKHYFTDVLTGAAIGTACGIGIPLLHRRGSALAVSASQGPTLAFSGAF